MQIILGDREEKTFEPFDRYAQFTDNQGKSLEELLETFESLRALNISALLNAAITQKDLEKQGIHPDFGPVSLSELLATWVVHDLNHIAQISRVMARQYQEEVGPWKQYLSVLK